MHLLLPIYTDIHTNAHTRTTTYIHIYTPHICIQEISIYVNSKLDTSK